MEVENRTVLTGKFKFGVSEPATVNFCERSLECSFEGKAKTSIELTFNTRVKLFRDEGKITYLGSFRGFTVESPESLTFYSDDQPLMQQVREYFRARVNLRGFHELFKAIKKIGKGSFASVYLAERLEDHKMVAVKAFSKEALR